MSIVENKDAFVVSSTQQLNLSQMFSVSATGTNPTYLVLSGLDRNEYTAAATGATGQISGNGNKASFGNAGSDFRSVGIVFTYQGSTGRYYNSIYGYFDQLTYQASGSLNDVTDLSLYAASTLLLATIDAADPSTLMTYFATGYLGTATIATQPSFSGTPPAQATPDSIASVAATFVGDAWNMNGCWVLASTIAAEAGAALPVVSTDTDAVGQANGEWMVAFNGPARQLGNWQSMVTEGDIIVINGPYGGHITTCVSGSGSTAMLIDNVEYVGSKGQVTNLANDGSSNDVTIAAAHSASQEWGGVSASSVVIYRLDTPVVTENRATASVATRGSLTLASIFSATDPANKAIANYQIYDTATSDGLTVSGTGVFAHTAATAATAMSLSAVCLVGGATTCTDTVEVRAYNGIYWGDWETLAVCVFGASAPTLSNQTAAQSWIQGSMATLMIAANTFTDPQGQTMTYAATLANGQALPSWLTFNSSTRTFSGTVPSSMQILSLMVTATDTSGLSSSESIQVTVPAAAPSLVQQTPTLFWAEGQAVMFTLPANTFADPQGQNLTYTAMLSNGQGLPGWLSLNPSTGAFSGTAPLSTSTLSIKLTATDTGGLSVSETFQGLTVAPLIVTNQTASQTWTANEAIALTLPTNTFTDPRGQTLTYHAALSNGAALPSGLSFNAATDTFSGIAPVTLGTLAIAVTATDTSGVWASETFQVIISGTVPKVANQTGNQIWIAGKAISLALPAGTFTDPQGETLIYAATLSNGTPLPPWLSFNATTGTFSGIAPTTLGTLAIAVTAKDTSGLSVSETIQAAITATAPKVASQTGSQTWIAGKAISLALPAGTFIDPQVETLTYMATLSNGAALPAWLNFNAVAGTFSGTAPTATGSYAVTVTATDTSGLSESETFQATVSAKAPTVTSQTASQIWTAGQKLSLALVSNTFADPQNESLTYTATLSNGQALPTWLVFNASTDSFSGTAPLTPQTLGLIVKATDASGLSVSETISATIQAAPPTVTTQTPAQIWTNGQAMSFLLPKTTFTDPQGAALSYAAFQVSGTDQTSWMHFNAATSTLSGLVPTSLVGTIGIKVVATDGYGASMSETFGLAFGAVGSHVTASVFTATELLTIHA